MRALGLGRVKLGFRTRLLGRKREALGFRVGMLGLTREGDRSLGFLGLVN